MEISVSMMPARRPIPRRGGKESNEESSQQQQQQQDESDNELLQREYYNFDSPYLFSTRKRLQDAIKRKINKNKDAEILAFLKSDRIATQYKPRPKRNFPRRKVETRGLWNELGMDLCDFQLYRNQRGNHGYAWLLVVVELVSRWVTVRKIKRKDKVCMTEAVNSVLDTAPLQKDKVKLAWVDRGQEFLSIKESVFERNGIKLIHVNSDVKSACTERQIRILKSLLFKLCDFAHSLAWVEFVDYVVARMNNTELAVLNNRTPMQIINDPKARAQLKWENGQKMLKFYKTQNLSPKFLPHDRVRILLKKTQFGKAHVAAYSDSLYTVAHIKPTIPLSYVLRDDSSGKLLPHHFYEQELSLVSTPQIRDIDDLQQPKGTKEKGLEEKTDTQRRLEEENKELYIAGNRLAQSRTLRSGRQTAPDQLEYELRDRKKPAFVRYISQQQKDQMVKDGIVSDSPDI